MTKRLNKEWKHLEAEPDEEDRFFAEQKINDREWEMVLMIDEEVESAYAGGIYKLVLTFPSEYPFAPPLITWTPPIYHPAVMQEDSGANAGMMEHSVRMRATFVLRDDWSPTRNVRWIMDKMYHMLVSEEITNYVVNPEISQEIVENYDIFKAKVQEQIKRSTLRFLLSPFPCDMKSLECLCQQYEDSGLHIGMLAFQRVLPQMYNHYGIRQNIIKFVFGFVKTERYHLKLSRRATH